MMKRSSVLASALVALATLTVTAPGFAQDEERVGRPGARRERGPGEGRGPRAEDGFRRPAPPIMRALDTDQDGQLSADEIAAAAKTLKTLDKNNDGKIDREELRPQFDGRRPDGEGRPQGRRGPGGEGGFIARIMELDENGDGKVDKNELPERMQRILDRADKNDDGAIDKAELEALQKEFQARFGNRRPGEGRPDGEGRRPRRPESEDE